MLCCRPDNAHQQHMVVFGILMGTCSSPSLHGECFCCLIVESILGWLRLLFCILYLASTCFALHFLSRLNAVAVWKADRPIAEIFPTAEYIVLDCRMNRVVEHISEVVEKSC